MKSLKIASMVLFFAVTMFACKKDETKTKLPCEEIGGLYKTNLTLVNRSTDPSVADYCVTKSINMIDGAGLIIEPGVVIEFSSGTNLQLGRYADGCSGEGYIIAEGTKENPIVFTGKEKIPGYWNGIAIGCNSNDLRNIINNSIIEYAGSTNNGYGLKVSRSTSGESGIISLKNTTIKNTLGVGFLSTSSNDAIYEFSSNIFENNSKEAIKIHTQDFSHIDSETKFINNGTDGVVSGESVFGGKIDGNENYVWHSLNGNAPFILNSKTYLVNGSLTIEPGATIILNDEIRFAIEGTASFKAIGTASNPITFKGRVAGTPSWKALYFVSPNVENELKYCNISEGGVGIIQSSSCNGTASVGLLSWFGDRGRVKVTQTTFSNGGGCGIFCSTPSYINQSNNTFTNMVGADVCN